MPYKLSQPGWFAEVNGVTVVHRPLPESFMEHAGQFIAHHGIETHRQQGSSTDLTSTQLGRGYPIATWNIGLDGTISQYNHMFNYAPWHGDSPSEFAFGVEHAGFTGTPFTAAQLKSNQALYAAIVEIVAARGETIPLQKVPRVSVSNYKTVKGFWDHDDVDNGPLNENGHTDKLEGITWPNELAAIGKLLHPTPAPTFGKTLLRVGVDAPDVIVWKRRMSSKNLFQLHDANDGPHYGNVIERATKEFQRRQNLVQDGVVGPKTWDAAWS